MPPQETSTDPTPRPSRKASATPARAPSPRSSEPAPRTSRRRAPKSAPATAPQTPPALPHGISPENTVFVSLCFEGPDVYSTAGGLGTRVAEFTEALASLGYQTHLIFVGDPNKPAVEERVGGRLHIERWGQWISKYYPNGVYDGEEGKLNDYNDSVPRHVCDDIAQPAIAQGKIVVVIGEDWHTAEAVSRVSDLLHAANLRHRALIMWNCNSLMSLHRINWERLAFSATITTVSRYMKHRLWQYNVNALVIPNGIPQRFLDPVNAEAVERLREVMRRGDAEPPIFVQDRPVRS